MASISPSSGSASSDPLLIPQGEYAGKQPLKLQRSVVTVGGDEHCHLHLISSSISRHHALIIHDYDGVYIRDLASRTKVVVNGQPQRETLLVDEDELHIGKFWFRFAAGASSNGAPIAAPAAQVMVNGKTLGQIKTRTLLIGKGDGCEIALTEESVSSRHAIIFTAKGKRYVRDLDSRSGTFLKGEKIHQHEIRPGDELRVGETLITLAEIASPAETAEPVVAPQPSKRPATPVAKAIPVAEPVEPSADSIPLELEPEESPEPVAARPAAAPPIELEAAPDPATEAPEPVAAAPTLDLNIETVPLDSRPAVPEPDAAADVVSPEPVSAKSELDLNIDTIPLDTRPETPTAPETDSATDAVAPEPVSAESKLDLNIDAIPLDTRPETPATPETDSTTDAVAPEPVSAESELDLNIDAIPLELEPETLAGPELVSAAIPLKIAAETPVKAETPEPEIESALPPVDLSETDIAPEPRATEEPKIVASEEPESPAIDLAPAPALAEERPIVDPESELAEVLPEPEVAEISVSHPPQSPGDLDLNLDVDVEPAAKFEAPEPPPIEFPEPIQPNFDLSPPELTVDEATQEVPTTAEESDSLPPIEVNESITSEIPPNAEIAEVPVEPAPLDNPPLEIDAEASGESETLSEKPRKRTARGRKTPAAIEPKPRKTTRARVKRVPPPAIETTEISAPAAEESITPAAEVEPQIAETPISPEPATTPGADEIPAIVISDEAIKEPVEEPGAEQVPDLVEEAIEPAAEIIEVSAVTTEEKVAPVAFADHAEESSAIPAEPLAPETPPVSESPLSADDAPTDDWNLPASATEEIPEPIISADQTAESPASRTEPEVPDAPVENIELPGSDWNLPAPATDDIPAPIPTDFFSAALASANSPPPAPRNPLPRVLETPLTSLGGFGFIGGGTVNVAHFLGGMPANLPELPPTPAGFGQIRIDMSSGPISAPTMPRQQPPLPPQSSPPPQIFASQELPAPLIKQEQAAVTPPPPPIAATLEKPIRPASPGVTPPPPPRKSTFATDVYRPREDEAAPAPQSPAASSKPSTAFDGLAMGSLREADVFSDAAAAPTPINDAPFGGAPMGRTDDYGIPDAVKKSGGNVAEKDFADDDFWNRTDEQDTASPPALEPNATPPSGDGEETPLPALSREELSDLHDEPAHAQTDVGMPPPPAAATPARRRRFRIPFLMPVILLAVIGALAAIWRFIPVHSQITGTMTFLNFNYNPGTQDSIEFEAKQRRLLDDQTRNHALEILARDYPSASEGFLKSPELFGPVAASISLSSSGQTASPQTLLQLSFAGEDKEGDRLRTLALLQSLADRNAPMLDANRRLTGQLQHAQQTMNDAQQKLDTIKKQIADLQLAIDAAPPVDQMAQLTKQKNTLERARTEADEVVSRDQAEIDRLQGPAVADAGATTQVAAADPQIKQMRQQLADLSADVDSARSDQLTEARLARQKLEVADQEFDEKIAAANTLLGTGSQLRQFVDSAMDSQTKARDLINMLIVDGEDLEQQLEDTRRDIEDLIQTQLAEKWAEDPQLQQFRENLESAQHRYNANTGQGITDPRILDPLQKEIDRWNGEVKRRQNLLGADPGEVRVQDSINGVIASLRKKLAKEKHQTDQVLDPLERQLADLDPVVAAMPAAQQDLARQIHQRLDALNEARQKYTKTVGDDQIAPSPKVTELKGRIADLRANIAARQADLEHLATVAAGAHRSGELAMAQAKLQNDQNNLTEAAKSLEIGLTAYDELYARQVAAQSAQQKKMNLMDDQQSAFTELQTARRNRDEKQSAADHAFDIKPVTSNDVIATTPPDSRMMYSLEVMAGGLVLVALITFVSHSTPKRLPKKSGAKGSNFDSLVIPLASDDEHTETDTATA